MSNTTNVSVVSTSWTSVAVATAGFLTNESGETVMYNENSSQPAANVVGHTLYPADFVQFTLLAGQELWVRSKNGTGEVTVTLD